MEKQRLRKDTDMSRPERCISAASEVCGSVMPGRETMCSRAVGWTSLLVQTFEIRGDLEIFDTLPSPDHFIGILTKGRSAIESYSRGAWRRAAYLPGYGGMTPGGHTSRLRWQSPQSTVLETLHVYIPHYFLQAAQDERRRAGAAARTQSLDALSFSDPVISQVAIGLVDAVKTGAPDLYAEAAAQFLAAHLLSTHRPSGLPNDAGRPGRLSDRRVARVLEYMNARYMEPLSLDQLAAEVCVSPFHFAQMFKKSVGVTPHRYLVNIRMNAASEMLGSTDGSILEIALACGYQNAAHFTAAFQKRFSQSPSAYRRNAQTRSAF